MKRARGAFWILITGGLATASLTVLFLGMRSVMDIGGSCGSIGTDGVIRPCPGNVAGLVPAAIWGGLIFTGLYVWLAMKYRVPSLVSLLWPALFLSLAYNFFDYGLHGGSVEGGFLVCGVVFALMGAVPLIWALPHLWRVYVHGQDDPKPWHVAATGSAVGSAAGALKILDRLGRTSNQDMTESLERLDELHKSGALDDFEYATAKDRVIRGEQA